MGRRQRVAISKSKKNRLNYKSDSKKNSRREKEEKGERGMPRLPEARKDAVSCENARGSANRN